MRRKNMDRRQALIACAQKIECNEGVGAINIRRVAAEVNISVGTVYNYFESKQEVLLALTEDYWKNTLSDMRAQISAERFSDQAAQIIVFLRSKMTECAEILMRSLHDDEEAGRMRMASMHGALQSALAERLRGDAEIRPGVWNESFTLEAFAQFSLDHMLVLLERRENDMEPFLEIVRRILY